MSPAALLLLRSHMQLQETRRQAHKKSAVTAQGAVVWRDSNNQLRCRGDWSVVDGTSAVVAKSVAIKRSFGFGIRKQRLEPANQTLPASSAALLHPSAKSRSSSSAKDCIKTTMSCGSVTGTEPSARLN